MLFSFLSASLLIAPFTAPDQIVIPSGFPSGTIPPQIFKKADWLNSKRFLNENFRCDFYEGLSRRRGNIVSLYELKRCLRRNKSNIKKTFYPKYYIKLIRYDCANDRYKSEYGIVGITSAIGGKKPGWDEPLVKVSIEGYPYWVGANSSPDSYEWIPIKLGTIGADIIDYACKNY